MKSLSFADKSLIEFNEEKEKLLSKICFVFTNRNHQTVHETKWIDI
jgi:hypothetical protein